MIVAEFLVGVALVVFAYLSCKLIVSTFRERADRKQRDFDRDACMRDDLREALASRDYRRLDDFLAVWADRVSSTTLTHVKIVRDELYVGSVDNDNEAAMRRMSGRM